MDEPSVLHGCRRCGKLITLSRLYCSQECLRRGWNREMFPESTPEAKQKRKIEKIVGRSEGK